MLEKMINGLWLYAYQQPLYCYYYKKLKVESNLVLLETTYGKNLSGHIYYIIKELSNNYEKFKLCVAVDDVKKAKKFLKQQNLNNVKLVKYLSRDYLKLLASSEYLINDRAFFSFFIKKEGQQYINFWRGTPLKTIGKDTPQLTDVANFQRNLYMADKIMISNEYTGSHLAKSHGLNGVYQGKMLIAPSPRNSILLDNQKRMKLRKELNIENKKALIYMPTWRGTSSNLLKSNEKILEELKYLDQNLTKDSHLFVKFSPFQNQIDLSQFHQISLMPPIYELYEFLTAIDVLITDYSSIMYDFLLTNRKIILYTYDQEAYCCARGMYDDINRYPFAQAHTISELIQEIHNPDVNVNYEEMRLEFCPYDHLNGVSIICDYIFNHTPHHQIKEMKLKENKETVVLFGGAFWDNGVTTALLNTFEEIDLHKRNYMVVLGQKQLRKEYFFRIRELDSSIITYPIPEVINAGLIDRFLYLAYMKLEYFSNSWIDKRVKMVVENDFRRLFGSLKIDHFIHFTGFGNRYAELLKQAPNELNKVMYIHTDMFQEYQAKKNFNKRIIFDTYKQVDKVAVVNHHLKSNLIHYFPKLKNKLYTMNNFLGEGRIRKLAEANLHQILMNTKMDYGNQAELIGNLSNHTITNFINIGRYDYQKGHERLIRAFESVYKQNGNTRLIIVAPHGLLRDQTLNQISTSVAKNAIYVLGRMDNPYPLLKQCEAFVLSSYYEGLGLVAYEALAVGITLITVDLAETIAYLKFDEAIIVDNSESGLVTGMLTYLSNGRPLKEFDFSDLKQRSIDEFEKLLE